MPSISLIIGCLFSILIIYYLKNLETIGCKCALNFKHDFIFIFSCIALSIGFLNILFSGFRMFKIFMLIIFIPYMIAAIMNLVFTIQYVDEMKKINCDCSESVFREMMYILAIINACVWALSILIVIFILKDIGAENNKKFINILWKRINNNK
jgi:hypothetical protein